MANYIRRTAVFNPDSERELQIWNWAKSKTNDFNNQNFAAFVRDKLEWCMINQNMDFKRTERTEPQEEVEQIQSKGWAKLI